VGFNDFDPTGPQVDGILADAARARRAGAEIVIASLHCCTEYNPAPDPTQIAIVAALLASPDVDLVIGHHAHVVQPIERINGKWVAYGLGNHVAQQHGDACGCREPGHVMRPADTRVRGRRAGPVAAVALPQPNVGE
jgi:poly-gamma-glutamate capsule biosynthesis protein CapA/YwtB (metallophosphatase superfamily)